MSRFTITTPIFYVNAPPHVGHAYTVVAADVLARFHRLRGDDVFFLTGTDEHGEKIAEAARAASTTPQALADSVAQSFRETWKLLDVTNDDFIRTTEHRHEVGVVHALRLLKERDVVYQQSYRGLYCTGCEKFLTEKDLDDTGKCPLHNRVPELVEETNWFFRLSTFLPHLKEIIERDEVRISPRERKNEVLGLLRQGLEDFSISRDRARVPWGIPLPFDATQTCYVWVDALFNYLTALGYGSPDTSKLQQFWPADVHVIGLDILKFHAVYWPAILLALGEKLPREIAVHGFFTVNGQKISKSLGNVIDPLELVKRYGSDGTRFLLLSQFPFGVSGDVSVVRFDEQYDAALANTIGNLVSRTVALLQKFSSGRIPNAAIDRSVENEIREYNLPFRDVWGGEPMEDDIEQLVHNPLRLSSSLNKFAEIWAPWHEPDAMKRDAALRSLAAGVAEVGILAEPILPKTSAAIQRAFGIVGSKPPAPGTPVAATDPPILFPRAKDL